MKTAEQWAEEFPVLVPANVNLPLGHPAIERNKREYRERYLAFIRRVQKDAERVGKHRRRKV